jgi:hypothetical protein
MTTFALLSQCRTITNEFISDPLADSFVNPPYDKRNFNEYTAKIKTPMDLNQVRKRLKENTYSGVQPWINDMHLIFQNCVDYNGQYSVLGGIAMYLRKVFDKRVRGLEALNLRNYESQLIDLGHEVEAAIRKVPACFNVEVRSETQPWDDENFTVDRIRVLKSGLEKIAREGQAGKILEIVKENNRDAVYPDDGEIELGDLGRRTLIALEDLVKSALH